MNNKVLFDRLNNIKNSNDKETLLTNLIKDIEIELLSETNKQTTSKARLNKIKSFFNKTCKNHSQLNHQKRTTDSDGKECIVATNSVIACWCYDGLGFGLDDADEKINFPEMKQVERYHFKETSVYNAIKVNVNELINKAKISDSVELNESVRVNSYQLVNLLNMMNFKNDEDIIFYQKRETAPLSIFNNNEYKVIYKGLICPMRKGV